MGKEKKVIIALKGYREKGKTSTLRKLALQFLMSREVEEDIQVGFLYKKPEEKPKEKPKVVVSTIDNRDINQAFCTAFKRSLILVTTTRTKDQAGNIDVVAQSKEYLPGRKIKQQKKIDEELKPEIETSIRSIAQEETATLRQFLQRLLESEVVGDIQVAFRYKGKKIVISTAGDDKNTVTESTNLFKTLEADILVTATRTGKTTKGWLSDFVTSVTSDNKGGNMELEWVDKNYATLASEEEQINEAQAKELLASIDQMIIDWEK